MDSGKSHNLSLLILDKGDGSWNRQSQVTSDNLGVIDKFVFLKVCPLINMYIVLTFIFIHYDSIVSITNVLRQGYRSDSPYIFTPNVIIPGTEVTKPDDIVYTIWPVEHFLSLTKEC